MAYVRETIIHPIPLALAIWYVDGMFFPNIVVYQVIVLSFDLFVDC
jgi:hypothetical protein